MDEQVLSDLYFDGYNITDINFKMNPKFENEEVKLNIEAEIDVSLHSEENKGYTSIKLIIWDKAKENNYPFRLEISIKGHFSADKNMDKKEFANLCEYNGSAILFPFLRSAVTDITKIADVTPLVLPLINIKNFIDANKKEEKQKRKG